jgi:DNA topoisomerase-1
MPYQLMLCEKPSAAARIARALGGGSVQSRRIRGVPTFWFSRGGKEIVAVPALGHLYTVVQKEPGWSFPIFDITWAPTFEAGGRARRLRAWVETISQLAEGADSFISACDFDTEGSLIAYMILKHACNGADAMATRMKFSTLTTGDLEAAYGNMMGTLDFGTIAAGKARHELDWIFGINISRALMDSVNWRRGGFRILSAGRVQSPTLGILHKRELAINLHVPDPYWTIGAEVRIGGAAFPASYMVKEILSRGQAEGVVERCSGKEGRVECVESLERRIPPPFPFDLTSLQREAYRLFRFTPSKTQRLAERLYLDALISYPRTSSQRLPSSLGFGGILRGLSKEPSYKDLVEELLAGGRPLRPREGPRSDQAHPAIHPTGRLPSRRLGREEQSLYDLVVRRFLATFGTSVLRETTTITILCGEEDKFKVRGDRTVDEGWMRYYRPYASLGQTELPKATKGDPASLSRVWSQEKYSVPPPRLNPGSLLSLMERNGLGTKSTRAEILDALYRRGYVEGTSMEVTELGLALVPILKRFFPEIAKVDLTRKFEEEMDCIEAGSSTPNNVISEAMDELKPLFERTIGRFEEVGEELDKAINYLDRNRSTLGKCPGCSVGELTIIRSRRTGKRFLGCTNYSSGCRFSLPLPQRGRIRPTGQACKLCGLPIIDVRGFGKSWRICVNDKCPSKR